MSSVSRRSMGSSESRGCFRSRAGPSLSGSRQQLPLFSGTVTLESRHNIVCFSCILEGRIFLVRSTGHVLICEEFSDEWREIRKEASLEQNICLGFPLDNKANEGGGGFFENLMVKWGEALQTVGTSSPPPHMNPSCNNSCSQSSITLGACFEVRVSFPIYPMAPNHHGAEHN